MKKTILFAMAAALAGCAVQPTKVSETRAREFTRIVEKSQKPIEINETTMVLDARSSFDYGLNHVRNSFYFPWSNLSENERTGMLMQDPKQVSLRLALAGITPETPIVVVDNGPGGDGEGGRLAWSLIYFGCQDVQVTAVEPLRKSMTPDPSPQAINVSPWAVSPRDQLVINQHAFQELAVHPKERHEQAVFILDVRSEKEYLKNSGSTDFSFMNVEWKQFYTGDGRPDPMIRKHLVSLGITPDKRVIVLSEKGVRSSAAAYALLSLGYTHVQNFVEGWRSLR